MYLSAVFPVNFAIVSDIVMLCVGNDDSKFIHIATHRNGILRTSLVCLFMYGRTCVIISFSYYRER